MITLQKHRGKANNRYQPPPSLDSSLSQSTPPPPVFRRVLATDPDRTAALWKLVRAGQSTSKNNNDAAESSRPKKALRSGLRSRSKGKQKVSKITTFKALPITKEQSILQEDDAEELDEAPTVPRSKPDLEEKKCRITVYSANFEIEVLIPRRIKISTINRHERDPFKHFGTDSPHRGEAVDYTILEGLEASQVWLSLTDDSVAEITEEYQAMDGDGASEAEYTSFAMEMFFKRQRRFVQQPSDKKWRTRRTMSLVCPPNGSNWFAPPPFQTVQQEFKFDVRPDCSYWLSLAGFNSKYRGELVNAVYVHKNAITCPYFTIEFKKQNQSVEQARVQAAASASVALYNRFLLKMEALRITETPWEDSDMGQMRHYVFTFVGSQATIWILEANLDEDKDDDPWNGCNMSVLWLGNCTSESVVRLLETWINEIHRWGLSQHAAGCMQDVKIILERDGLDTSLGELELTGEQGPEDTGEQS